MSVKYRLVLVEWVDSFGCTSRWNCIEPDESQTKRVTCRSVGWLTHDGDETKVVAPHVTEPLAGEKAQSCGDMSIPVCCILSITDMEAA